MMKDLKITALIASAGSGSRMGANIPKQFINIKNKPVLMHTLDVFDTCPEIDDIVIISRTDDIDYIKELLQKYNIKKVSDIVSGGDTRQKSVINGLNRVNGEIVLIHDGARPFVTHKQIRALIDEIKLSSAASLGIPVTDTLKLSNNSTIVKTVDRENLYAIQTPQGFKTDLIKKAHKYALENSLSVTDDCSVCEAMGVDVKIVTGSPLNIKITTPDDLVLAEGILNREEKSMRVGMGYDVHKLVENRKLILGGIEIPYELGLLGHSDADVLLHAIMDALLGAAALGDIGKHFPDTDNKWKGADSKDLFAAVYELITKKGAKIINIDATVIAQRPKLAGYIPEMVKTVAEILNLDIDAVNIKATTTEKLGFCGRGEGIAAEAICSIEI